ncbi:MAG: amidohydrolase family protein [Gemmatimonadetes bacterium]|nr:amidohydrolase family protein [Gemmatimonadota bacterium]
MGASPMRRHWLVGGIIAASAALPVLAQSRQPDGTLPQPHVAFINANVVDVRAGTIKRNATVVVRGGRIAAVSTDPSPSGATIIDLKGKYLAPGLMDAHTHLDNLAAARRALETGVTTVRSASVGSFRDVALREMVRGGFLAGPDVLAAGLFVTPQLDDAILADPALAQLIVGVTTIDRLRQLVRVNLAHGVDVIKTRGTERAGRPETDPRQQTYSEVELKAIVDEAATKNVPILAHAHGDEGAYAAVKAGVRSIEHGTYLSDSTLALMKARGTYLVPTYSTLLDLIEPGGDYDDPVTKVRGMHMLPRMQETLRKAHQLGIPIVTGADVGYTSQSVTRVAHEVANFAALGMTPADALRSATVTAAELFRIADRTGAVEPGLEADLIVVEHNPLERIGTLQDVLYVISNGRVAVNRLGFGKT